MIKAYCDSSFDEKLGVAGIGIVIEKGCKRKLVSNWISAKSWNGLKNMSFVKFLRSVWF